jgi:hypothetical protein
MSGTQNAFGKTPYHSIPQNNLQVGAPDDVGTALNQIVYLLTPPTLLYGPKVIPLGQDGPITIDGSPPVNVKMWTVQNTGAKAISIWYSQQNTTPIDVETLNPGDYRAYPTHIPYLSAARTSGDTTASITYTLWA